MRRHNKVIHHCRLACRALGGILAVILIVFLYLSTQGIPRHFIDQWLGNLGAAGYRVTVERIRLDLLAGIVAENFRAFEDADRRTPMLEADRVVLSLNPLDWRHHKTGLRSLRIYNGLLRLGLVDQPEFKDSDALVLRNVDGAVKFGSTVWQLTEFSADLLGLKINCSGAIHTVKPRRSAPAPLTPKPPAITSTQIRAASSPSANTVATTKSSTPIPVTRKLGMLGRSQHEKIFELIKQLNAITFAIPPHADIDFQIYTDDPSANTAKIRMEGAETTAFGMRFDQWRLAADLSAGKLRVDEARLQRQDRLLLLSGSYLFANSVVEARLRGRSAIMEWLPVIPRTACAKLAASGFPLDCPIRYDIQVDPSPITQAVNHVHGQAQLGQTYVSPPALTNVGNVKGLWVEECAVEFAVTEGALALDRLYLALGQGKTQGTFQGSLNYAFDSGDYDGQLAASFDPQALLPFIGSNASEYIEALAFKDGPPVIDCDFYGQSDRYDAFRISGRIQGSNFIYNAVPVTSLASRFDFSGGILSFDAIHLVPTSQAARQSVEGDGAVSGRMSTDLSSTVVDFDVLSAADPVAVIRLISTNIAGYLGNLRVAGTNRIAAKGRFDYDTGALTDIKAAIEGSHWIYPPFYIDRCSLKMTLLQSSIDLTDICAEIGEGRVTGKAYFYPDENIDNFRYAVNARTDGVNLNTLIQMLGFKGSEDCDGFIQGQCELAGNIGSGCGKTAIGAGQVRIDDGLLFQVRMFGGLSRMLAILNPNLGAIDFTDFSTDLSIKDCKVSTRNGAMSGPALAVHGEGLYAFDGNMDFVVWAQIQQHYRVFNQVNTITAPLAKLLAFRLTGTTTNPKWWPMNLTKDQLLAMPKELLITMPKNVLMGLPQELLVNLPRDVLITLPRELLITLPKAILINLPKELLIELPKDTWRKIAPQQPAKTNP